MDRGAWWTTAHGMAKSQIRLTSYHFHFHDVSWVLTLGCVFSEASLVAQAVKCLPAVRETWV